MQTQGNRAVQKRQSLDLINIRRNPYLVDYEEQKRLQRAVNGSPCRTVDIIETGRRRAQGTGNRSPRRTVDIMETGRRAPGAGSKSPRRTAEVPGTRNQRPVNTPNRNCSRSIDGAGIRNQRASGARNRKGNRSVDLINIGSGQPGRRRNPAAAKRAAIKRRRRQMLRRRMMLGAWTLCLVMIGWLILLKVGKASEAEQDNEVQETFEVQEETTDTSSVIVQGLSSDIFAKHPAWEENFLPVNEYSRPGETLPEVKDIFVHYTANPGTSAAQNRSYFEQQKDMHEASVSAHFIIGYEGEIIQCVPLDEIAYAVQTRNYDSISIECCYKASDGSFTQETYDSLISLLAWLTDSYDLDTNHILRHYDCGGKKCPLYYTEHEDAWAQLKADVAAR